MNIKTLLTEAEITEIFANLIVLRSEYKIVYVFICEFTIIFGDLYSLELFSFLSDKYRSLN